MDEEIELVPTMAAVTLAESGGVPEPVGLDETVPREAVVSIIAMVEASKILQSMKIMDTARAHEVVQSRGRSYTGTGVRRFGCPRLRLPTIGRTWGNA